MATQPMEVTIGLGQTLYVQERARTGFAHEAQAWCSCHPDWQVRVAVADHLAAACKWDEPEPVALTLLRGEAYEAHKAAE